MTIFFTSDLHAYHENIIRYCNRPFWKKGLNSDGVFGDIPDVELMNETLLTNWNAKVKPQDTVYFLGDFAFADQTKVRSFLEQLNGNIYLCRGNHDKPLNSLHKYFTDVFDLRTIKVPDETIAGGIRPVVLCHYPLLSFDRQRYGAFMLHGHVHSTKNELSGVKRYDVGVDANNFTPVSFEEIRAFLEPDIIKPSVIELK